MKKALGFIGDAWHAPHATRYVLNEILEQAGYETHLLTEFTTPTIHDVDFSTLSEYDLVIIGRYALDDHKSFKPPHNDRVYWLSEEQQRQLRVYVENGGNLFFQHDGVGFYPDNSDIAALATCTFVKHPPITDIKVYPIEVDGDINEGIEPYCTADEEMIAEPDENITTVFLKSHSEKNGTHPQGWYHNFGKGKVAVFIPGHDATVLRHPMVRKGIENVVRWFNT